MFQLGMKQTLIVEKPVPMGLFLKEPSTEAVKTEADHVLLPRNQVPEEAKAGDELEVFLYKDSEDRLIATRKEAKLSLHEVGYLTVKETGRIGAFLDWGLDNDLLLPYHEQPRVRVQKGQEVLCAVYIDKSGRLCATMNVYPYLRTDSPYEKGQEVSGTVYQTSDNFGTFVAVDDIYSGLIPKKELVRDLKIGEKIRARVTSVKEDGKLNLAIREKTVVQMGMDADVLMAELEKRGGALPFTDKAAPELIRSEVHMSKNEFKRAIGRLLKEGKVSITEDKIILK